MLVAFGVASPFLLRRVAGRQALRRLPCGCRKRATVSRCVSCVPLSGRRHSAVSGCRSCPPWRSNAVSRSYAGLCLCRRPHSFASGLCGQNRSLCRFRCSTSGCRCLHRWCLLRLWPLLTPVSSCWYSIHSCNLTPLVEGFEKNGAR